MKVLRRLFYCTAFWLFTVQAQAHIDSVKVYLPFYGNLNDWSGWNNPGSGINPTFTADRNGAPNKALLLTGNEQHIDVPAKNILNEKYTYSQWLRLDEKPGNDGFVVFQLGDSGVFQTFSVFPGPGDTVILDYTFGKTGEDSSLRFAVHMPLQTWNHVAFMRSADSIYCFYNTHFTTEKPIAGNRFTKGTTLRYGKDLQGQRGFMGAIDEVRVFSENIEPSLLYSMYIGEKLGWAEENSGLKLYPNPAFKGVLLESEQPMLLVEIIDARGVLAMRKVLSGERKVQLDLLLPPGIYFVNILCEGALRRTERLLISAVPE